MKGQKCYCVTPMRKSTCKLQYYLLGLLSHLKNFSNESKWCTPACRLVASTTQIYVQLILSYLTLSPGKLFHNPRKSFFSGSIPLLLAVVSVSPKLSDNNGLDKRAVLEDNNIETVIDLTLKLLAKVVQNIITLLINQSKFLFITVMRNKQVNHNWLSSKQMCIRILVHCSYIKAKFCFTCDGKQETNKQ